MKNDLNNHLERLQSLTSNYELLQGYPIALAGLLFILEGIAVMIWGQTATGLIYSWLFLPSLALLAITLKIAVRYHRRKFGLVKASMGPRRTRAIIAFTVLYFVLLVLGGADFKHLKVALEPTVLNGGIILVLLGLLPGFPWRHLCGSLTGAGGHCLPSRLPRSHGPAVLAWLEFHGAGHRLSPLRGHRPPDLHACPVVSAG